MEKLGIGLRGCPEPVEIAANGLRSGWGEGSQET
jgi:hypothetical protein